MRGRRVLYKPNPSPAKPSSFPKKPTPRPQMSCGTQTHSHSHSQSQSRSTFPLCETHFISLIHASKTPLRLKQIHAQIIRHSLSSSSWVITQLISSSSSLLKSPHYALSIFCSFNEPNVFVFNALIRALAENSDFESLVSHYNLMLRSGVRPNWLTVPFVLKSAAALLDARLGVIIHGGVMKLGVEFESFVRVSLVDMYVKVGRLGSALQVFDESPEGNKVESILLWNVLINGCCRVGDLRKATELFEAMPERNEGSWNSLINGFMKNGEVVQARELFERMPEKNVVSWTTMVAGFSQIGDHERALSMFFRMLGEGVRPNDLTIVSAILACAKLGALESGVRIHCYISNSGFQLNKGIGTALVDMYSKCGNVESASIVFNHVKHKDLLTWSVMIWGWAIHGHFERALQCFNSMKAAGIKPDGVVFLAILTACSHSGQVNEGLHFFDSMRLGYSIEPTMKHYNLVVDLFCRAGRLEEALNFVIQMPITPDFVIWGALFCACRAHKNIEIAEFASQRLLQLEPKHPGSYVFLSNIYAGARKWEEVEGVRDLMKNRGVDKFPGWSYIELGGQVHSFVSGDHAHELAKQINMKLEEMITIAREQGYIPETEWVLHNIEEEEKENALGRHSEKLALAFGLISTPPGMAIRIVKNLRVCGDCHSLMKYASQMSQREIVLRDIKRFHHFKNGICSCGDYW